MYLCLHFLSIVWFTFLDISTLMSNILIKYAKSSDFVLTFLMQYGKLLLSLLVEEATNKKALICYVLKAGTRNFEQLELIP